jgi:L-asparaginase II
MTFVHVATTFRGGLPESRHFGAAAVATPDGRLVAALGDPEVATFLRSATKPFQALLLVEGGGVERFELEAADLALICASHGGRREHVARAAALLARGGFGVDDLLCGAHPPLDASAAKALPATGEPPTPLHNNCSGKHAGMLLACRLLGLPTADYVAPDHPLQRRIRERVAACCRLAPDELGVGVDGCSAPAFHLPLAAAARGWAALAAPDLAGLNAATGAAAERLLAAMAEAPEMVAGPGRFTSRLIEVTGGRVIGKEGAEGVYAMAVRGPVALGIALKIADGADRARDGVALDLLRHFGSLSGEEAAALATFRTPVLRNHRGLAVGEVVPEPLAPVEL